MTAGLIRSAETVFAAQMASSPRVRVTATGQVDPAIA